jgi:tetraacyldisaccharide 4'-kinase
MSKLKLEIKLNTPRIWRSLNPLALLLWPLSWLYWLGHLLNYYVLTKTRKVKIPVICIGNVTVGGSGKTPVALSLAKAFLRAGIKTAVISRGYTGSKSDKNKAHKVVEHNTAAEVGDEAKLLSHTVTTYICPDRYKAAKLAQEDGAKIVIMDDGLQNNSLHKDVSLCVIGESYLGNGLMLPAGPLREPLWSIKRRCKYIINTAEHIVHDIPALRFEQVIANRDVIYGKKFVALTGIAVPDKFFNTLEYLKCELVKKFIYPDHHLYTPEELAEVESYARKRGLKIITTSKDAVKIKDLTDYIVVDHSYAIPSSFVEMLLHSVGIEQE